MRKGSASQRTFASVATLIAGGPANGLSYGSRARMPLEPWRRCADGTVAKRPSAGHAHRLLDIEPRPRPARGCVALPSHFHPRREDPARSPSAGRRVGGRRRLTWARSRSSATAVENCRGHPHARWRRVRSADAGRHSHGARGDSPRSRPPASPSEARTAASLGKWRRVAALRILARAGDSDALLLLERALGEGDRELAGAAVDILGSIGDRPATDLLVRALQSGVRAIARRQPSRPSIGVDRSPSPPSSRRSVSRRSLLGCGPSSPATGVRRASVASWQRTNRL